MAINIVALVPPGSVQTPRNEEEAKAMMKVAAIYLQAKKIERGEEGLEYIEVIHKLLGQR